VRIVDLGAHLMTRSSSTSIEFGPGLEADVPIDAPQGVESLLGAPADQPDIVSVEETERIAPGLSLRLLDLYSCSDEQHEILAEITGEQLRYESLLRIAGPYFENRNGHPPAECVVFDRLNLFGQLFRRCPDVAGREYTKQMWAERLKEWYGALMPWPIRVVEAAIKAGAQNAVPVPTLGLDVRNSFLPVPIDDFLAKDGDDERAADWLVEGLTAREAVTVVAGPPKVGKTTFCAHLGVAVASGFGFLDRSSAQVRVLWINLERPDKQIRQLFREMGGEGLPLDVFSRTGFRVNLADLAAYLRGHEIGLVVIDSLSKQWAVEDENDARQVELALTPILQLARETRAAVVLIHHTRKSGGEDGEEVRGSSAVVQNVEILLSLKRHRAGGDTARALEGTSNYQETPRRLVVAYRDGLYTALGTPAEVADRTHRADVLDALTEEPQTYEELKEASGLHRKTVQRTLTTLHEEGLVNREGEGKRGDPFRFTRNDRQKSYSGQQKTHDQEQE
jgi:DNA-binding transcriptional ArsR family regulator